MDVDLCSLIICVLQLNKASFLFMLLRPEYRFLLSASNLAQYIKFIYHLELLLQKIFVESVIGIY